MSKGERISRDAGARPITKPQSWVIDSDRVVVGMLNNASVAHYNLGCDTVVSKALCEIFGHSM